MERDVLVPARDLKSIAEAPLRQSFAFDGSTDDEGRRSETVDGEAELSAAPLGEGVFKVSLVVRNRTSLENAAQRTGMKHCCDPWFPCTAFSRLRAANLSRRSILRSSSRPPSANAGTSARGRCWPETRDNGT